jgi:cellulose synthase/poly-beta-1,6-N-acetylglucosamine synthase-like glycosyltransferase
MIDNLIIIIASILNFLNSTLFILILLILIIVHQVLLFFTKDISHIKVLKDFDDPEVVNISDLKDLPLVNIIIPAWKEGKLFEDCLLSITKLNYPHLKVIVSAGGNEETIQIVNSFKKFKNFIILKQKPGGKMKALNDCLKYVSEGIIYSIDADVILNNEILLRMLYPLVNENQYVTAGSIRPLKFQENIDIVKYMLINRNTNFRIKFSRIGRVEISGPNSCFKYEVIEKIGNFFDDNLFLASDRFRGPLIFSKGFKIYWLTDYRGKIFTFFPDSLKKYFLQEFRWRKNSLTNPYMKKKVKIYIKFLISFLISIYLLSSPFFIFFNINLALIGLIMLLSKYLKKLRKIIFFKRTANKKFYEKFGLLFFLKLVFFIYTDVILTFYLGINLLITRNKQPKIMIK